MKLIITSYDQTSNDCCMLELYKRQKRTNLFDRFPVGLYKTLRKGSILKHFLLSKALSTLSRVSKATDFMLKYLSTGGTVV